MHSTIGELLRLKVDVITFHNKRRKDVDLQGQVWVKRATLRENKLSVLFLEAEPLSFNVFGLNSIDPNVHTYQWCGY